MQIDNPGEEDEDFEDMEEGEGREARHANGAQLRGSAEGDSGGAVPMEEGKEKAGGEGNGHAKGLSRGVHRELPLSRVSEMRLVPRDPSRCEPNPPQHFIDASCNPVRSLQ